MDSKIAPLMFGSSIKPGRYHKYARHQKIIMSKAIPRIIEILDNIQVDASSPFAIGDYGCSDGGNSLENIEHIIDHVKAKHGEDQPISVFYVDQPANDFSFIFKTLEGIDSSRPSYKRKYKNVCAAAIGRDFYTRCVHKNTMHLILCFSSLHWLSPSSIEVRDNRLIPVVSPSLTDIAAQRYETFLLERSKELVTGGHLCLQLLCVGGDNPNVISEKEDKHVELLIVEESLRSLVKSGVLTQEEKARIHLPLYMRTKQELRSPFEHDDSSVRQSGLNLIQFSVCDARYSALEDRKENIAKCEMTVEDVMKEFTEYLKEFLYNAVFSAFHKSRTYQEKIEILDTLFQNILGYYLDHPDKSISHVTIATVLIKKTDISMK